MAWGPIRANVLTRLPAFSCVGFAVCALLATLAIPTLGSLITTWNQHPDYAHGWLLLPVTLCLFAKAQPWSVAGVPQLGLGSVTICAGGILHLAAQVIPWPLIDYAGWVLILRGVVLCWWGRDAAWRVLPVLAFAILMFPLPVAWLNAVAILLQNLIAQLADIALNLIWVCHRRGHLLYLAGMDEPLSVAVECSGIRQMLVFVAMSWLLAFFVHGRWWRRVALVAVSIPIAIIANVLRVLTLAIMARLAGPSSIQGALHDAPLLMTLPLGGILLWWCFRLLNRKGEASADPSTGCHGLRVLTLTMPAHNTSTAQASAFGISILLLLLVLQFTLTRHLNQADTLPTVTQFSFKELPWQLGPWQGQPHPEADRTAQVVDFADALTMRAYFDNKGHAATVYLVFSATGRDRLHHPEICLRDAGGAVELKHDRLTVPLQADTQRFAERFRYLRQRQERTVVYYWHYTFMPPIKEDQSLLQRVHLKQYDSWPGITVQVQTNMNDPATWKLLETTLLPEVDRWVSEHVPDGAQVGTDRLPVRFTHE
ncbi:MAG TPA: exosortase/archaeosortase family protein [Gemmatales bacterium]|nr:exosortase/archaeosortase family protein [Gemmatales bacterium]